MRMTRTRLIFWLAALALVAAVALGCLNDRYSQVWKGDELPGANTVFSNNSRFADDGSDAAGPFTWGPAVNLQKGSYRAIVRYTATEDGCEATVGSDDYVNSDNAPGLLLATAALPAGTEEITIPFTLEQPVRAMEVRTSFGGSGTFMLHSVSIVSNGFYSTDHLFLALLVLAAALLIDRFLFARRLALGEELHQRLNKLAPAVFVVALGLLASYPFLMDFVPRGHDMPFHMTRIDGIADGLRAGQFPVRIQPTQFNGKGYAVSTMYPDLFLWPFALLRVGGVSLLGCYQAMMTAINIATAAVAYYSASRLFASRWVGAVFTLLYTLAAYRLVNVVIRSALGEALAMVFLPLVVLGLYEVVFRDEKRWPLLVAGATGVFQSHVITTALAGVCAALVVLVRLPRLVKKKTRLLAILKTIGLCLLLNLWFILPFLYFYGQGFTVTDMGAIMENHALYPGQLFMNRSSPGGGSAEPGRLAGEMLLGPGLPLLLAAGLFVACLLLRRPDGTPKTAALRKSGRWLLAGSAVCLWLTTTLFPWQYFDRLPLVGGKLDFIQFPWRFLTLVTLFLALVGAIAAVLLGVPGRFKTKLAALAVVFVVCAAGPFTMMDQQLDTYDLYHKYQIPALIDSFDRLYLYPGTPAMDLANMKDTITAQEGEVRVWNYVKNGTSLSFACEAEQAGWLEVPLTWYPGYTVTDGTGAALATARGPYGQMLVQTAAGAGTVLIKYTGLWWFRLGDAASLLTILALCGWGAKRGLARRRAARAPRPAESKQA